jgi:hypothetical protein
MAKIVFTLLLGTAMLLTVGSLLNDVTAIFN